VLLGAAERDRLAVVKYLIEEQGADPHVHDDGCARWALLCGCVSVLRYLIGEHGVDPAREKNWMLRTAADVAGVEMVRYLVEECGVDPRVEDDAALLAAAGGVDPEAAVYLAGRIFDPGRWRGKGRSAIEAEARRLAARIDSEVPPREEKAEAIAALGRRALLTVFELEKERARANPPRFKPPAPPRAL
jgi:hypothetical protein